MMKAQMTLTTRILYYPLTLWNMNQVKEKRIKMETKRKGNIHDPTIVIINIYESLIQKTIPNYSTVLQFNLLKHEIPLSWRKRLVFKPPIIPINVSVQWFCLSRKINTIRYIKSHQHQKTWIKPSTDQAWSFSNASSSHYIWYKGTILQTTVENWNIS